MNSGHEVEEGGEEVVVAGDRDQSAFMHLIEPVCIVVHIQGLLL